LNYRSVIKVLLLLLTGIQLIACSGPMVRVDLAANPTLNPDKKGDPLPVVVRVYQLTDKGAFESATFNQLWKSDEGVLGKTLLTRNEVIINPDTKNKVELDRNDKARYVGVVAIFRNPIDQKWRELRAVSHNFVTKRFSTSFDVNLNGNTLQISD
jgi:type VI secretion system protein VasD